jgi:hypothetical protein
MSEESSEYGAHVRKGGNVPFERFLRQPVNACVFVDVM